MHQQTENICHISIPLNLDGSRAAVIAAAEEQASSLLQELAKSMDTECLPGRPVDYQVLLQCDPGITGKKYLRQGNWIEIHYSPSCIHDNRESLLFRQCVFSAITMACFADGKDFALFHGTFLEENQEEGILLFGESGIGKSTTYRRWLAEGGCCTADDALLLFYNDGQFYVRPLPTWSHWLANGNQRIYPVKKAFRVRSMYWLTRDAERQQITLAEPARYHCQILSAMLLHAYGPHRTFSSAEIMEYGEVTWQFIQRLDRVFPARAFRAHLEYPLKDTLYGGNGNAIG